MHVVFIFTLSVIYYDVVGAVVMTSPTTCRCAPDQWEGILHSIEHEYDLEEGAMTSVENSISLAYDYTNRRFAMTDLETGSRVIADYARGYKYVIYAKTCNVVRTDEEMRQMCLPDNAQHLGRHTIGTEPEIDLWQFTASNNVSMRSTITPSTCIPLTEEVTVTRENYGSVTMSYYFDVTVGIKDESVFLLPVSCYLRQRSMATMTQPVKREENSEQFRVVLRLLRKQFGILY